MTPFERFLSLILTGFRLDLTLLAKLGTLILLIIYLTFSFVVVRQVKLMSRTFHSGMEMYLLAGAWALVGLAGLVLLLALIIL